MDYFVRHGRELTIFVVLPFIGLALEIGLTAKQIRIVLIAALVLLAPALTGYDYVIESGYRSLVLLAGACLYTFVSSGIERNRSKFIAAFLCAVPLLVILGYGYFINTMGGNKSREGKWDLNGYRIEYFKDQGFSGSPLYTYELARYAAIPLFIKHIETAVQDSADDCSIHFETSRLLFDKCKQTLVPAVSHTAILH